VYFLKLGGLLDGSLRCEGEIRGANPGGRPSGLRRWGKPSIDNQTLAGHEDGGGKKSPSRSLRIGAISLVDSYPEEDEGGDPPKGEKKTGPSEKCE